MVAVVANLQRSALRSSLLFGAQLLLSGKFDGISGVLGPNDDKKIWDPVLKILEKEGIRLTDETTEMMEV